jgi:hypothetical protein
MEYRGGRFARVGGSLVKYVNLVACVYRPLQASASGGAKKGPRDVAL